MRQSEKYKHIKVMGFQGRWTAVQSAWDEQYGSFALLRSDEAPDAARLVCGVDDEGVLIFICRTRDDLDTALNKFFHGNRAEYSDEQTRLEIAGVEAAFEGIIDRLSGLVHDVRGVALVRDKCLAAYVSFLIAIDRKKKED